jgi:hypothetical protein
MKGLDDSSTAVLHEMAKVFPERLHPALQEIYNLGVIDGKLAQLREMVKERP